MVADSPNVPPPSKPHAWNEGVDCALFEALACNRQN